MYTDIPTGEKGSNLANTESVIGTQNYIIILTTPFVVFIIKTS